MMQSRFQKGVTIAVMLLVFLLLPAVSAYAQGQTLDQALQPENAQGKGTDMLKKAAWLMFFYAIPIMGVAMIVFGLAYKGGKRSEWGDAALNAVSGFVIALAPAIVGFMADLDLYQMYGING